MSNIIIFLLCIKERNYAKPCKYIINKIIEHTKINFSTIKYTLKSRDISCNCMQGKIEYINNRGESFCKECFVGITFIWANITPINMGNNCYGCELELYDFYLNHNIYCQNCILKTWGTVYHVEQDAQKITAYYLPDLFFNKQCQRCMKYKKKMYKCPECTLFICGSCFNARKFCEHKITRYLLYKK